MVKNRTLSMIGFFIDSLQPAAVSGVSALRFHGYAAKYLYISSKRRILCVFALTGISHGARVSAA